MQTIDSIEALEALYLDGGRDKPKASSLAKEVARVTPEYAAIIRASPFVALATSGPEGLDCSPRGDLAGFVHVDDETTLMLPDRRGNNRLDSLRNIVRDPRVALLFLIPGIGTTLRVNGRARLRCDAALLGRFAVEGSAPRSVIEVQVERIYFQCARAIVRSELWNPARHVAPESLPTPGQILAALTDRKLGGEAYDAALPARIRDRLW